MKTNELIGAALDWAVAKCEGVRVQYDSEEGLVINNVLGWIPYRPSVAWQQGGPIIERQIARVENMGETWEADCGGFTATGDTALIAAMRCYVASKLGDELEIPEELI